MVFGFGKGTSNAGADAAAYPQATQPMAGEYAATTATDASAYAVPPLPMNPYAQDVTTAQPPMNPYGMTTAPVDPYGAPAMTTSGYGVHTPEMHTPYGMPETGGYTADPYGAAPVTTTAYGDPYAATTTAYPTAPAVGEVPLAPSPYGSYGEAQASNYATTTTAVAAPQEEVPMSAFAMAAAAMANEKEEESQQEIPSSFDALTQATQKQDVFSDEAVGSLEDFDAAAFVRSAAQDAVPLEKVQDIAADAYVPSPFMAAPVVQQPVAEAAPAPVEVHHPDVKYDENELAYVPVMTMPGGATTATAHMEQEHVDENVAPVSLSFQELPTIPEEYALSADEVESLVAAPAPEPIAELASEPVAEQGVIVSPFANYQAVEPAAEAVALPEPVEPVHVAEVVSPFVTSFAPIPAVEDAVEDAVEAVVDTVAEPVEFAPHVPVQASLQDEAVEAFAAVVAEEEPQAFAPMEAEKETYAEEPAEEVAEMVAAEEVDVPQEVSFYREPEVQVEELEPEPALDEAAADAHDEPAQDLYAQEVAHVVPVEVVADAPVVTAIADEPVVESVVTSAAESVAAASFVKALDRLTQLMDARCDALEKKVAHIADVEETVLAHHIVDSKEIRVGAGDASIIQLGVLEPLLKDPQVTDVMINGAYNVFVEKAGVMTRTPIQFEDNYVLLKLAQQIAEFSGRVLDADNPIVDARLPDGSRVNIIVPPLALDGVTISIRKFGGGSITLDTMVNSGVLSQMAADFLKCAAKSKVNIIVSGGTGTGKTTLLNSISRHIDAHERIVTIEDSAELQLQQPHVVRLEASQAKKGADGHAGISIRDLVKNALRMRPERILVGESRGAEAFDMIQAMNTGHDGSFTTIHANTPRDAVGRLENMINMANLGLPLTAIRKQIASAVHLIIQTTRMDDGSRRITHISEIVGMEGEIITMQDIFTLQLKADANGKQTGGLVWANVFPRHKVLNQIVREANILKMSV